MSAPAIPPPLPYPLDLATFRTAFTAFADTSLYPDASVQMWLDTGAQFVNCNWGPLQGYGQGLWAAHEIAKLAQAASQAASGNPGGVGGIVQSKSVGPVSVSYDTQLGTEGEAAGQYNLTIYGRQYWHYVRLFGMGAIQVGAASAAPFGSGIGWIGPPPWPGWLG